MSRGSPKDEAQKPQAKPNKEPERKIGGFDDLLAYLPPLPPLSEARAEL